MPLVFVIVLGWCHDVGCCNLSLSDPHDHHWKIGMSFWCEIYIIELNIFMYFEQNGGCFHMKFINMWTKIPVKKSYETLAPSSILLSFSISHLPLFCFAQAGNEVLKSWSAWVRVSSVYVTGMVHLLLYLENIFNHVKNPCSSYKT